MNVFSTAPAPQIGDKIFIQLEAGQVNGVHKFSTHWVQTSDQYPSDICDRSAFPRVQKFDPTKASFEIYPVPVNTNAITASFNFSEPQHEAALQLYSMDGRLIKTLFPTQPIESVGKKVIDLPIGLPNGVYLLRLQLKDSVITKRIEIIR